MVNKSGEVLVDAFGVVLQKLPEALKCDKHLLEQYGYALNKETGVFEVVEKDPIDLTEIIQSNKDNCGLNLALLNIKRGVDPGVFADDGKHGGDFSGSTNINEVYQAALNSKAVIEGIAKKLGIDSIEDGANLESVISQAIQQKIEAAMPKKEGEQQ